MDVADDKRLRLSFFLDNHINVNTSSKIDPLQIVLRK